MSEAEPFEFPEALDPTKTYYPPELLDEREIELKDEEMTRFERLDDAEVPAIMAKFAILRSFGVGGEGTQIRVARGEGSRESFMSEIGKMWHSAHKSNRGMSYGDIELIAAELGVYEIIWPFDPELMAAEAEHVAKQFTAA